MPGTRFCEECGAEVESGVEKNLDADGEIGIILTRESHLLAQVECSAAELHDLIGHYIDSAERRGIHYRYYDLDARADYTGDGDAESVVAWLRNLRAGVIFKYVFILGNEKIVDVARWENGAGDTDKFVEGDFAYTTLTIDSPWSGYNYDFLNAARVGRLPTYKGESFRSFSSYFENAIQSVGVMDRIIPYGLSALVWEEESNYAFRPTSTRAVAVSPNVTTDRVKGYLGFESNLLYFNLHGSDQTRFWYGQNETSYPEAFEPSVLHGLNRPYAIGVEACYGARYLGGLEPQDSILLTALENRCISFLGSSRIAYGTSQPTGSCADLVVGTYIHGLAQGCSAGDAYVNGLCVLVESGELDDTAAKTLAEFSLYGDPSVHMRECTRSCRSQAERYNNAPAGGKGVSIVEMPDIRRAVGLALTEVNAKIEALVDEVVMREAFNGLDLTSDESISQSVYKVSSGLYQKVYSRQESKFVKVVKAYFDDDGTVRKLLLSK